MQLAKQSTAAGIYHNISCSNNSQNSA